MTMEQTQTTTAATQTTPKTSQIYAVMQQKANPVAWKFISAKQKRELSKLIADESDEWDVVGVFKGKQLLVKEKKAFNFS